MPSPALSDPRSERAANDAERGYIEGRDCPVCHRQLATRNSVYSRAATCRSDKHYCSARCRMFAWRRNGDPDGPLDHAKARAWRP